jgi:hypothetical protein
VTIRRSSSHAAHWRSLSPSLRPTRNHRPDRRRLPDASARHAHSSSLRVATETPRWRPAKSSVASVSPVVARVVMRHMHQRCNQDPGAPACPEHNQQQPTRPEKVAGHLCHLPKKNPLPTVALPAHSACFDLCSLQFVHAKLMPAGICRQVAVF